MFLLLDKLRFVPIVNIITLLVYYIDSMRYPDKIRRIGRCVLTVFGSFFICSLIALLIDFAPIWIKGCVYFISYYVIILAGIHSVRNDILLFRGLSSKVK